LGYVPRAEEAHAITGSRRKKHNFRRMAVLVVDDIDLSIVRAQPNYVIETSPGNYQAGYIIRSGRGWHSARR
jgi:hypothetical protein